MNVPVVLIEEPTTDVTIEATVVELTVSQLAGSLSLVAAAADVDMAAAVNGALPVYRASSQKFEVRPLLHISENQPTPADGEDGDVWFKVTL